MLCVHRLTTNMNKYCKTAVFQDACRVSMLWRLAKAFRECLWQDRNRVKVFENLRNVLLKVVFETHVRNSQTRQSSWKTTVVLYKYSLHHSYPTIVFTLHALLRKNDQALWCTYDHIHILVARLRRLLYNTWFSDTCPALRTPQMHPFVFTWTTCAQASVAAARQNSTRMSCVLYWRCSMWTSVCWTNLLFLFV